MLPDTPTSLQGTRALVLDAPGPGRERLVAALTGAGAEAEVVDSAAAASAALSAANSASLDSASLDVTTEVAFDVVLAEVTAGGRELLDRAERPPLVLLDTFGTEEAWAVDRDGERAPLTVQENRAFFRPADRSNRSIERIEFGREPVRILLDS